MKNETESIAWVLFSSAFNARLLGPGTSEVTIAGTAGSPATKWRTRQEDIGCKAFKDFGSVRLSTLPQIIVFVFYVRNFVVFSDIMIVCKDGSQNFVQEYNYRLKWRTKTTLHNATVLLMASYIITLFAKWVKN